MTAQQPLDDKAAAERKARHEAWLRTSSPNEHHRALDAFAGAWDGKVQAWFMPGQPPAESTGRMVNTWIVGNRFLRQDYRSHGPTGVFEGAGFFGHDNQLGKYVGIWVDVMSTSVMRHEGTFDPASRTFTMLGSFTDPTGQPWRARQTFRILSNDEHIFESFQQGPTGPEYQALRVVYARAT